jgi:hypothetical protein
MKAWHRYYTAYRSKSSLLKDGERKFHVSKLNVFEASKCFILNNIFYSDFYHVENHLLDIKYSNMVQFVLFFFIKRNV